MRKSSHAGEKEFSLGMRKKYHQIISGKKFGTVTSD